MQKNWQHNSVTEHLHSKDLKFKLHLSLQNNLKTKELFLRGHLHTLRPITLRHTFVKIDLLGETRLFLLLSISSLSLSVHLKFL